MPNEALGVGPADQLDDEPEQAADEVEANEEGQKHKPDPNFND